MESTKRSSGKVSRGLSTLMVIVLMGIVVDASQIRVYNDYNFMKNNVINVTYVNATLLCIDSVCVDNWGSFTTPMWLDRSGSITSNSSFDRGNVNVTGNLSVDNVVSISSNNPQIWDGHSGTFSFPYSGISLKKDGADKVTMGVNDLSSLMSLPPGSLTVPGFITYTNQSDINAGFWVMLRNNSNGIFPRASFTSNGLILGSEGSGPVYGITGGSIEVYGDMNGNRAFLVDQDNNYNVVLGSGGLNTVPDLIMLDESNNTLFVVDGSTGNITSNGTLIVGSLDSFVVTNNYSLNGIFSGENPLVFPLSGSFFSMDGNIKSFSGVLDIATLSGVTEAYVPMNMLIMNVSPNSLDGDVTYLILGQNESGHTFGISQWNTDGFSLGSGSGLFYPTRGGTFVIWGDNNDHPAFVVNKDDNYNVEIGSYGLSTTPDISVTSEDGNITLYIDGSSGNINTTGNITYHNSIKCDSCNTEDFSIAFGEENNASLYSSVTGGFNNTASGIGSTITGGFDNVVSGAYSYAMGYGNHVISQYSTALGGQANTIEGDGSTIIGGFYNNASGNSATILASTWGIASGDNSVVIGGGEAKGNHSTAIGVSTSLQDTGSTWGIKQIIHTRAYGNYSTAIGDFTEALGDNSVAIGTYTNASGNSSMVFGSGGALDMCGEPNVDVINQWSCVKDGGGCSAENHFDSILKECAYPNDPDFNSYIFSEGTNQLEEIELNTLPLYDSFKVLIVHIYGNLSTGDTLTAKIMKSDGSTICSQNVAFTQSLSWKNITCISNYVPYDETYLRNPRVELKHIGTGNSYVYAEQLNVYNASVPYLRASGSNSVAIGMSSTASGQNSISIGTGSIASGVSSMAIGSSDLFLNTGNLNLVNGTMSNSLGTNLVDGIANTGIGFGNNVNGIISQSYGVMNNVKDGFANFGIGLGNYINSSQGGVAIGITNGVISDGGVAVGTNNIVNGTSCIAIGSGNIVDGSSSFAIGVGNIIALPDLGNGGAAFGYSLTNDISTTMMVGISNIYTRYDIENITLNSTYFNINSKTNMSDNVNVNKNITIYGDVILPNLIWDDVVIYIGSLKTNSINPAPLKAFRGSAIVEELAFEDKATANEQSASGAIQFPHALKQGYPIECHIHWSPSDTTSGNVNWTIEYTFSNITGTYPVVSRTYAICPSGETAWSHNMCSFGNLTSSDSSGIMAFSILRASGQAGDTYNGHDAFGVSFDCHVARDSLGSREMLVKW